MPTEDSMNAWAIDEFGEPDFFRKRDVTKPIPGPGEVLVRVAASSVNPVDCKIRRGERPLISPELPAVLHGDVAGTVEAIGEGVSQFAVGGEVFGMAGGLKNSGGALADFMRADCRLLAHKPKKLAFSEAAALPLVTITAWEGLHDRANIQASDSALIHAGAGGVGHVAAQLAAAAGARTATTVSSEAKADAVRSLISSGIEIINYRKEHVSDYVKRITDGNGFDIVFDTIGGDNLTKSFDAVRRNGRVINILSMAKHDLTSMHLKALNLHVVFMLLPLLTGEDRERHGEILATAATLADAGKLRPLIDSQYSFDDAGEAHRRAESGKHMGKVVLVHPDFA